MLEPEIRGTMFRWVQPRPIPPDPEISRAAYELEKQSEHRTYARDHNFEEWADYQLRIRGRR